MNDRDWRTLIHNIETGDCILVLGPDLARRESGGESKTLSALLANRLADSLEQDRKVIDRNNLFITAQQYAEFTSEEDLRLETVDFYEKETSEISILYSDLAHLPFQLIVNATPDTFLIRAMEKAGKESQVDYYNYRGEPREMAKWDSRSIPLVYYLYGTTTNQNSLVISEKHLLEFLVAVTAKDPPLHNNIMSELRDKEKSFLFLGFGFRNWYLRILLFVLLDGKTTRMEKTSRSFALEEAFAQDEESFQQVSFLFSKNLKINFSGLSVQEFVKELRVRYAAEAKPAEPGSDEQKQESSAPTAATVDVIAQDAPPNAPTVFICHASEDKELAMKIWAKLKEAGLNPWIDKEGIRGGDQWDVLLEKQIKAVDYFVVVQSKAMSDKAKKKSYVNKEIKLAREEQLKFPVQIAFILPVKIEECELREELLDWQTTDLTEWKNIENLLRDIRRDQQRRKK